MQREAMVLTAPEETYVGKRSKRRNPAKAPQRDPVEDFAQPEELDGGYNVGRRRTGLRLTFRGGLPTSVWGRVATGAALLAMCGAACGVLLMGRRVVLHDDRFVLSTASAIQIEGMHHLTRGELLDVFADDVERNVFNISLEDRRAALEQIPWVKRATVMRLMPDHLSIAVEERTPVAFVRQGGHIGLVDAGGVLLDMGAATQSTPYSFPVVTGIAASDPLSVRAARMKIYEDFTRDLDASGDKISAKLSEVDLSNPEDVKALIPDNGADVLVHFGDSDFLDRYRKYEAHLAEWRAQYPKLSSVDMRYERQVVLEMQPGTPVPLSGVAADTGPLAPSSSAKHVAVKTAPAKGRPLLSATSRKAVNPRAPVHAAPHTRHAVRPGQKGHR